MASNPGGVNLNISPYFDDYDEDKKFVRVLYRPGRAVQARELTQSQTYQQKQIQRFADYFFKQGSIVNGCEQNLDLRMEYVKLQSSFGVGAGAATVNVASFLNETVVGANTGVRAYVGLVSDVEGDDPKTLFINYTSSGSILVYSNTLPSLLTVGNTIFFQPVNAADAANNSSTGGLASAIINGFYDDPITGQLAVLCNGLVGTPNTSTTIIANTITSDGGNNIMLVTGFSDKRTSSKFENNEKLYTYKRFVSDFDDAVFANTATSDAVQYVENRGAANEVVYKYGSKFTLGDGTIYLSDHFIKNDSQTIILDKYKNTPSYKIGVVPSKSFVDTVDDQSLLDNAQGTPNFQALGADRLRIDTVLTKLALSANTDETEFISVTEVEAGLLKRKFTPDVESKLEEAIAKRTFEESGNYTLSDPKIFVREHLKQTDNTGKFAAAEGGNNELLVIETDPFISYVKGFRNELLVKAFTPLRKGTDEQFIEQTKTTLVSGSYIPVKELVGAWDIMENTTVDLYDTAQQAISNASFSSTSLSGTKIGEARIRAIEYASGVAGRADTTYNLYLYDISMNPGKKFQDVRSLYDDVSGLPDRYADVVVDAFGNATLRDAAFEPAIFRLPYTGTKTIRDLDNNVEAGFEFKKEFSVFFNATGIITLITTDLNETFASGASDALKNQNYLAVPTITANTGAYTGTVTTTSGNALVVGLSTAFTTQWEIGDVIRVGGQDRIISSVVNTTHLLVSSNFTTTYSANTYSKVFPAGLPVRLYGQAANGTRSVALGSAGAQTVEVDLKESNIVSSAGSGFTARVIATMDRANARETRKILANNETVIINANTHPNGFQGPYGLGYGDVYQIRAIYQSTNFSTTPTTSNTVVTDNYTLDNGQRDTSYEHGSISPKIGVVPSGQLLVVFDHFNHDTSQGLGYLSIDSYPINDASTSNTSIRTDQIPIYRSRTGTSFDLRDCLDFRAIKAANTTSTNPLPSIATVLTGTANVAFGSANVIGTGTTFTTAVIAGDILRISNQERIVASVTNNTFLTCTTQFSKTATIQTVNSISPNEYVIPGGGLHFPVPSSDYTADLIIYKGRKAKLYVDENGELGINDGSPGYPYSSPPPTIPDTLEIAELTIPVYPSLARDIQIESYNNRRFTMRDIGKLKTRVEQLEYYATLNETERKASEKVILDDAGLDKYKNGVLVDTFDGHNIGDVNSADYKVSIDRTFRYATAYANNQIQIALKYNTTGSSGVYRTPGNKLMLDYTEETFIDQPYASQTINLAQELTFTWTGDLEVVPATDNWMDTNYPPDANTVVDLTGFADNFRTLVDAWNTEVAPMTRFWTGEPPVTSQTNVGSAFRSFQRATTWGLAVLQAQRTITTQDQTQFETRGQIDIAAADVNRVTERVSDVSIKQWMRPRDFIFQAQSMKDGARVYAFFDDINVTANCTQIRLVGSTTVDDLLDLFDTNGILATDNTKYVRLPAGTLRTERNRIFGLFRVPENRYYTGQRTFRLTDDIDNRVSTATTIASTSIFSQGLAISKGLDIVNTRPFNFRGFADQRITGTAGTRQVVISDETSNVQVGQWDPLSQSFYVDENVYKQGLFVSSLDLFFKNKTDEPNLGVTVEIREMQNGFPTRRAVGDVSRRENAEINVSTSGTVATTFEFKSPIYLAPGVEYCFVAKPDGNSTGFDVFVAELGQFDITNPEINLRIDKQAAAGILFTSANDFTWSARQNQDVKFKLKIAKFLTTAPGVAVLQNMDLTANSDFEFNSYILNIENLTIPKTDVTLESRVSDASYAIADFKPVRNLERVQETAVRIIANTVNEAAELSTTKSMTVRATLTTENAYITPYIDLQRMNAALEQTLINNLTYRELEGGVSWSANNTIVTGAGTSFDTELSAGEFVLFGEEYRQIASITNSSYMEVKNAFTTSGSGATVFQENEENPTGPYASESRYITRVVKLNDGFESSDLAVYVSVNKQQSTSIKVYYKVLSPEDTDPFESKFWNEMVIEGGSTTNQNSITYNEEKYVVPIAKKTGGSQLLRGTVSTTNGDTIVSGSNTVFLEELTVGSTIAIGTSRLQRTITAISNNNLLAVDDAFTADTTGQEVYKVLNNSIGYTTPEGKSFDGFKFFAIKVVFLSTNRAYAPKIKELRAVALA
jgi:hypothetical protein